VLRRVLPVAAVAAATVVLVPSTASATPAQAQVDSYAGQSLFATARDVVLPNGWHATASLSESRGTNLRHGVANLYLDVWTTYPCWGDVCEAHSSASAELTDEQIDMDRSLRTASVRDVSVELVDPAAWLPDPLPEAEPWPGEDPGTGDPVPWTGEGTGGEEPWTGEDPGTGGEEPWTGEDPGTGGEEPWTGEDPGTGGEEPWTGEDPGTGGEEPWTGEDPGTGGEDPWTGEDPGAGGEDPGFPLPPEPEPMTLTVSLAFTGTGPIDRSANHYTMCGDGDRICQAIRVEAHRAAAAQLVIGDQSGDTTDGDLFFGRFIDAAAPKFVYDGQ
jgi:hypothetical protein